MPKAAHSRTTSKSRSRSSQGYAHIEKALQKVRPLELLPFVAHTRDKTDPFYPCDFWAVAKTGNGLLDRQLGHRLAEQFVEAIGRQGPEPTMDDLSLITDAMMKKGTDSAPRCARVSSTISRTASS